MSRLEAGSRGDSGTVAPLAPDRAALRDRLRPDEPDAIRPAGTIFLRKTGPGC